MTQGTTPEAQDAPQAANASDSVTVRRPRQGLPDWALFAFAGLVRLGIFAVLAGQREDAVETSLVAPRAGPPIASPRPLILPLEDRTQERPMEFASGPFVPSPPFQAPSPGFAPPAPRIAPPVQSAPYRPSPEIYDQGAPPLAPPPSQPSLEASVEPPAQASGPMPALVLDRGVKRTRQAAGRGGGTGARPPARTEEGAAADRPLRPEAMATGSHILPSGTLIPAVLETPVDTARGGPIKALVDSDVRGFDGRDVLVPKGSRLLGTYAAGADSGKRVLITWNRIVLPDGQMVRIDYPATDRNGTAGVEGKVHNNTLGRVAGAVLQTALNTASFGLLNRSTGGTVVVGAPMPQLAPGTQRTSSRRITVPAGTAVNAFVAQPIDFSPADA